MMTTAFVAAMLLSVIVTVSSSHGHNPQPATDTPQLYGHLASVFRRLNDKITDLQKQIENSNNVIAMQGKEIEALQKEGAKHNQTLKGQSGTILLGDWPDVDINAPPEGSYYRTERIAFSRPFYNAPVVSVSLYYLDVYYDRNTRVRCLPANVVSSSFDMRCNTWANTKVHAVGAS